MPVSIKTGSVRGAMSSSELDDSKRKNHPWKFAAKAFARAKSVKNKEMIPLNTLEQVIKEKERIEMTLQSESKNKKDNKKSLKEVFLFEQDETGQLRQKVDSAIGKIANGILAYYKAMEEIKNNVDNSEVRQRSAKNMGSAIDSARKWKVIRGDILGE